MKIRLVLTIVGLLYVAVAPARADLVITVGDQSLPVGTAGDVPVYISSTTGMDELNSENFAFQITATDNTLLDFGTSPLTTLSGSTDLTFSDASATYLFHGDSFVQMNAGFGLGNSYQTVVPFDTFAGGDGTNDSQNMQVTTSPLLLAMLPLVPDANRPAAAGDTFTISLIPSSDAAPTNYDNSVNLAVYTGFIDANSTFYPYSSVSGTVTITAVPEPSTWLLSLAASGMIAGYRAMQRRKRR